MSRIHGNHPAAQGILSLYGGRPANLEDQVVTTPAGAISPYRLRQFSSQRQLVPAHLIPTHSLHHCIAPIANPIHVSHGTIESDAQTSIGLRHLKRNSLRERDSQ